MWKIHSSCLLTCLSFHQSPYFQQPNKDHQWPTVRVWSIEWQCSEYSLFGLTGKDTHTQINRLLVFITYHTAQNNWMDIKVREPSLLILFPMDLAFFYVPFWILKVPNANGSLLSNCPKTHFSLTSILKHHFSSTEIQYKHVTGYVVKTLCFQSSLWKTKEAILPSNSRTVSHAKYLSVLAYYKIFII